MKDFFKKSRIKLQELLDDIAKFTREVYKQSPNLYTPASPWGQIILVLSRLAQLMFYYIEDSITELNINSASRPSSIYGLARLAGHNPTRAIAAMGDLYLLFNGNYPANFSGNFVIIPNYINLKCKNNGLNYIGIFGKDELKIDLSLERSKIFFKVLQGEIQTQQFTGTGRQLQSFECAIPEGKYIDNFFVNVFVNGERWKRYESLYDIPNQGKGYIVKTGITSGIDIYFGTGNFGAVPDLGSTITVEYLVTNGFEGNLDEYSDLFFEFKDTGYDSEGNEIDLNEIFNIATATPVSFGTNPESTSLTRLLAPKVSRSLVLATTDNYKTFFEKLQLFSYIDVYTEFNLYDPKIDNMVYILLVPDLSKRLRLGENYFNLPLQKFKLSSLEKFRLQAMIEDSGQKLIGTILNFVNPMFKRYCLNIYLNIWSGYNERTIKDEIIKTLSDYFLAFKRQDYLPKSDLIVLIENIPGVDSVNLNFISEDVENEIALLLKEETMYNSILDSSIIDEIYETYLKLAGNNFSINDLPIRDKLKVIFSNKGFKKFIRQYIDETGDIVIGKQEYPIIRGGWYDRYGKYYNDKIDYNSLGSVNIYINQIREK